MSTAGRYSAEQSPTLAAAEQPWYAMRSKGLAQRMVVVELLNSSLGGIDI